MLQVNKKRKCYRLIKKENVTDCEKIKMSQKCDKAFPGNEMTRIRGDPKKKN